MPLNPSGTKFDDLKSSGLRLLISDKLRVNPSLPPAVVALVEQLGTGTLDVAFRRQVPHDPNGPIRSVVDRIRGYGSGDPEDYAHLVVTLNELVQGLEVASSVIAEARDLIAGNPGQIRVVPGGHDITGSPAAAVRKRFF